MKKLALLFTVVVSLCAVSAVEAQSDASTTTATRTGRRVRQTTTVSTRNNTTLNQRLRRIEQNARTVTTSVAPPSRIDGSVTRVVRSNSPLQMINPLAPKEYGDGSDVTRREPEDPYQRPEGLRLFAVEF